MKLLIVTTFLLTQMQALAQEKIEVILPEALEKYDISEHQTVMKVLPGKEMYFPFDKVKKIASVSVKNSMKVMDEQVKFICGGQVKYTDPQKKLGNFFFSDKSTWSLADRQWFNREKDGFDEYSEKYKGKDKNDIESELTLKCVAAKDPCKKFDILTGEYKACRNQTKNAYAKTLHKMLEGLSAKFVYYESDAQMKERLAKPVAPAKKGKGKKSS